MSNQNYKPDYELAEQKAQEVLNENFIIEPPILPDKIASNYDLQIVYADFGEKYFNVAGFLNIEQKKIFVNSKDAINRQTFTVAHELGHWILHKDIIIEDTNRYTVLMRRPIGSKENDPLEKEANCFAANLLVPKKLLNKYKDVADITTLAKIFVVSQDVIGFRLNFTG